jgi:tetratricopeptide (TPR) repeat protein
LWQTHAIAQRSIRPRGRHTGVDVDPHAVRRARDEAGLSQAQLGAPLLTRQAVHLIETGKVRPSRRSLTHIASRLNVPITALLREGGPSADERVAELERLSLARRYAEVLERAQSMLRVAREGPSRLTASAHHFAGVALYHLSRPQEALPHLREAQQEATAVLDPWLAAESLDWEAASLHAMADMGSLDLGREALRRYRQLQPRQPEVEARMLEHLGTYWSRRGAHNRAEACYHEALHVVGTVRDMGSMGRIYHGLAGCAMQAGDLRGAIELMRKAVAFYSAEHELRPAGLRLMSLPRAENDLGMLLTEADMLDQADEQLNAALRHFTESGFEVYRSYVLGSLSDLRKRQGRLEEAMEFARGEVAEAERHDQPVSLASGWRKLGDLNAMLGRYHDVDECYGHAFQVLERAGLDDQLPEYRQAYERLLGEQAGLRQAPGA